MGKKIVKKRREVNISLIIERFFLLLEEGLFSTERIIFFGSSRFINNSHFVEEKLVRYNIIKQVE